jgi:hypothetical protein
MRNKGVSFLKLHKQLQCFLPLEVLIFYNHELNKNVLWLLVLIFDNILHFQDVKLYFSMGHKAYQYDNVHYANEDD